MFSRVQYNIFQLFPMAFSATSLQQMHGSLVEGLSSQTAQGLQSNFKIREGGGGMCPPTPWSLLLTVVHSDLIFSLRHSIQRLCPQLTDHNTRITQLLSRSQVPQQNVERLNQWLNIPVPGVVKEGCPKFNPRPRQGLNLGPPGWQSEIIPTVLTSHTSCLPPPA